MSVRTSSRTSVRARYLSVRTHLRSSVRAVFFVGAFCVLTLTGGCTDTAKANAPTSDSRIAPTNEAQIAPKVTFDSAKAWGHLQKQVGLGPRPSGTPAIVETRKYIIEQLKASGIEAKEQAFIGMTPLGEVTMSNVIATIPGK